MTLRVGLRHETLYRYDRPVQLGPQTIRLRPAPHCRTPIEHYALRVDPPEHTLNWQQDPHGNFLARVNIAESVRELHVVVDLDVEMVVINPFDFLLDDGADCSPFRYEPWLREELEPYLAADPPTPKLTQWLDPAQGDPQGTVELLVSLARRSQQEIRHILRYEPGVQTPEETLIRGEGSCRDSAWLLVQVLRNLGIAARFASGYLIQLASPTGDPPADSADLHAWAEAYLPGAGWVGLDGTSGLLAGAGHLPLACSPKPQTAAAITGKVERCEVDFSHEMSVERLPPQVAITAAPAGKAAVRAPDRRRELIVHHHTRYDYEGPVERSSHRVLLRPVQDREQQLVDYALNIDPMGHATEYEDVFGNAALAVAIDAPFQQLEITSRATVRVAPVLPLEQRTAHGSHAIPLVWMPWQRQMLSAYLMPPELPEGQLEELSAFAMSFVERNRYDLVDTLLELNETIYRDFEYVSGSTTNQTTAFEAFESRRGVCQDFANLMICLARLLHVPARYRMGYILTEATTANAIQSEASHAWVELYLPRVGWHGFDPTNGIQVGADHIRVACGRNYQDATPTSGTIHGGGAERLTISVRVAAGDDAEA